MTHLEDRITKALTQSPTSPSPDLFDRVVESIDADRRRRRAGIRAAAAAVAVVAVASTAVLTLTPRRNGVLEMPWWILEVATDVVLIAIAAGILGQRGLRTGHGAAVGVLGSAGGRHPARHRPPARDEHRAHAGARATVLPQPPGAGVPGWEPPGGRLVTPRRGVSRR